MAIEIHTRTEHENGVRKSAAYAANNDTRVVGAVVARQCHVRYEFAGLIDAVNPSTCICSLVNAAMDIG